MVKSNSAKLIAKSKNKKTKTIKKLPKSLSKAKIVKLSSALKGTTVKIIALHFNDETIRHKLTNIGFVPGAKVKVLDYNKSNNVLHLEIFNIQYVLRERNCNLIDVEVI